MMISETKSILSFPDLIARQLICIHYTCFTVFVQFILGPLGRVALSPTAQMIEAEFSSLYASNRLDMLFCMFTSDNMTLLTWYGEDAEKAVYESFPDYDGSGYLIFTPGVSRKTKVVPPLTATLEKWTESGSQTQPSADE